MGLMTDRLTPVESPRGSTFSMKLKMKFITVAEGLQRTTVTANPQPWCEAAQNEEFISSLVLSAERTAQGQLQCLTGEGSGVS